VRTSSIFRQEAIDALSAGQKEGPPPLQILPRWTGWTYWVLIGTVALGLVYAASASVAEYADGAAVVQVEGRLDLGAARGGLVESVEARPGQRVAAGQVLLRLRGDRERRRLEQLEGEFELRLVHLLLHPRDEATRQSLAALREQRQVAEAELAERTVVAPRAGVVANLRVRPGQLLAPGEPALTLIGDERADFVVLAVVPGQFRPMLRPGMKMRFELEGFPRIFRSLPIESVAEEVIAPGEVRRYLGRDVGERAPPASMVLVRARLPEPTFTVEGKSHRYQDGIPGRVDIPVRSMPLLAMLVPPLRGLFDE
jgi:multidrug efflux pump subunit AcrA (membrane-fusion protein)